MLLFDTLLETCNVGRVPRLILVLLHTPRCIGFTTSTSAMQLFSQEIGVVKGLSHARVITISSSIYERAPLLSLSSRNPYARFPEV